jgi:glutamate synthase domain-containing protein 2
MIEIQLGQGAQASTPQTTPAQKIDEELREIFGLKEGEDAVIAARLPEVESKKDLKNLVFRLKEETGGVPVAYKFAATHYLEKEMEIALSAGVDVIVVDGAEAGTHAGQPLLEDDFGLPTMHALVRAADYLEAKGVKEKVSLVAGGGLFTPGHFLKAMALGADAVYLGTVAVMAMIHTQMAKTAPMEPPTQLALYSGKLKEELDVELAAKSLTNFLRSCVAEMVLGAVALGKEDLRAINREDLCALTPYAATVTGVAPAYRERMPHHPQATAGEEKAGAEKSLQ